MPKLTIFSRLIRLPLKLIPKEQVLTFYSGPLKGFKWIAGSSNHGYWLGFYERRMKRILVQTLKPGQVFLDLGGHVGYYTLIGSRIVGPQGSVITFEPLPRNIEFLKEHLRLNSITNVVLYEGAIAHFEGVFKLTNSNPVGAKLSNSGQINVKVYSLKKLLEERIIPIPHLIKMDIEGEELELLKSIRLILEQNLIQIFLSTHGTEKHNECLRILRDVGYSFIPLDGPTIVDCTEVYCLKKL